MTSGHFVCLKNLPDSRDFFIHRITFSVKLGEAENFCVQFSKKSSTGQGVVYINTFVVDTNLWFSVVLDFGVSFSAEEKKNVSLMLMSSLSLPLV